MNKLDVGLGQINPTVGDFEGNVRKICAYIDAAELQNLDLVIFPELAVCGYPVWDLANNKSFVARNQNAITKIVRATKGKRVTVACGFIDSSTLGSKKTHNALAVIRGGRLLHKQHKILLPTYDVFLEQIFFSPGRRHGAFTLKGIKIGTSICEDIWDDQYPIRPAQILARQGAQMLINISASPYHKQVEKIRGEIIRRKAREYGLWIFYVNQVGGQDDLIFDGRSMVCDPKGRVCFQADPFRESLYRVSIDLDDWKKSPKAGTVSSFFKKLFPTKIIHEMYQALVLGLRDYVRKNGFKTVAIGLSGGIDSALVASIAKDALGAGAVVGVALPGPYSSARSLRDARALAGNLGIQFRVLPIRSQYRQFIREISAFKRRRGVQPVESKRITLAMENLQARLRALELMYLSNDEGALLLTTGNKSELAMGYSTLYGDMCGGLSVIGDVYKTDVYRLARYRNRVSPVIPHSTISRAPSAELRPHQKDRDSLPPYPLLDQILERYIERNETRAQISAALGRKGASQKMVNRVIRSVDHNEYKRRQLPPSLRITQKAWFGRRMPITNHFEV